ncbi:hypothetical protein PPS11_40268 [Pseudomonas putida S11]|nr:hypothetical protein PPS11_40268 [Pseudomonas putida S11]
MATHSNDSTTMLLPNDSVIWMNCGKKAMKKMMSFGLEMPTNETLQQPAAARLGEVAWRLGCRRLQGFPQRADGDVADEQATQQAHGAEPGLCRWRRW